jgi:pimeloyl-ACP methyl ester carboxylesterase
MPASLHCHRSSGCLAVALAGLYVLSGNALCASPAQDIPRIQWLPCDRTLVTENDNEFNGRLSCARFRVPLDHVQPDGRTIEVGAVRMAAADSTHRKGVLFVNVGGPGGQPALFVPALGAAFASWPHDDPLHGMKRELVDRYDIVAVIPRALSGGWTLDCTRDLTTTFAFLPTHRDDANWARLVADARATASACTRSPEARYLSTEQHVHDMDYVRRALGEERIHFYGASYGGRVGAWYAAMYPHRMGRMLLDSSMVFPASYTKASYAMMDAQKRHFDQDVLGPVLADPLRYGQPADRDALRWAPHVLHAAVRPYWHDMLTTPERLAAALTMSRWLDDQGWKGWRALGLYAAREKFSEDAATAPVLRMAARHLLMAQDRDVTPRPLQSITDVLDDPLAAAVNLAVLCNDEASWGDERTVRAHADNDAFTYPIEDGLHTFSQLVCANWGPRTSRVPDLDTLAEGRPFLMIHADGDRITPIEGPRRVVLPTYPNAHLITVTGSELHGLLGQSDTSCVEHDAVRYLVDGTLPAGHARASSCAFVEGGDETTAYDF